MQLLFLQNSPVEPGTTTSSCYVIPKTSFLLLRFKLPRTRKLMNFLLNIFEFQCELLVTKFILNLRPTFDGAMNNLHKWEKNCTTGEFFTSTIVAQKLGGYGATTPKHWKYPRSPSRCAQRGFMPWITSQPSPCSYRGFGDHNVAATNRRVQNAVVEKDFALLVLSAAGSALIQFTTCAVLFLSVTASQARADSFIRQDS